MLPSLSELLVYELCGMVMVSFRIFVVARGAH